MYYVGATTLTSKEEGPLSNLGQAKCKAIYIDGYLISKESVRPFHQFVLHGDRDTVRLGGLFGFQRLGAGWFSLQSLGALMQDVFTTAQ